MNRVRLTILPLTLLIAFQLAGAWAPVASAAGEVIRQGVLIPYEITGPDGWVYNAQPHEYVLGVFKPEEGDLYPYISLTMMGGAFQQHFTPEALVERNLYERPGAELISRRWVEREDGEYLLVELSWSSVLGKVRAIKAFHARGRAVLVITASCLADEYDEYRQVFIDSLSSVRVKAHPDVETANGGGGDASRYIDDD